MRKLNHIDVYIIRTAFYKTINLYSDLDILLCTHQNHFITYLLTIHNLFLINYEFIVIILSYYQMMIFVFMRSRCFIRFVSIAITIYDISFKNLDFNFNFRIEHHIICFHIIFFTKIIIFLDLILLNLVLIFPFYIDQYFYSFQSCRSRIMCWYARYVKFTCFKLNASY